MKSTILVITCGGIAADIREELGSRCNIRKIKPNDPNGQYGDFRAEVSEADAVMMKMKYPKVVRII